MVYEVDEFSCLPPQVEGEPAAGGATKQVPNSDTYYSSKTMNALLRPYLSQDREHMLTPLAGSPYAPRHLLSDCAEGGLGFDGSPLAQAAQFAQRPDQVGTD
jgi:hypothetical protein